MVLLSWQNYLYTVNLSGHMTRKMKCPFKGCAGVIDLDAMFESFLDDVCAQDETIEMAWCIHCFYCPTCNNPIGDLSLGPDSFVINEAGTAEKHMINDTRTGDAIDVGAGKHADLDEHLKKWARLDSGDP